MYPLVGGAIPEEQLPLMMEALPGWSLRRVDGLPRLEREFPFPDFKQAMEFSNQLAELAETQGHHPTLLTEWGKVTVGWWTHDVGGVHANDFLSARRSEARFRTGRSSEAPGTAQN
ncbi:4a-hydroxytetrahydrobiopterin dehydratase [bacterium]|nr:4a-hydroxytetrahydrobiopterin dehydratase [bacterium]